MMTSDEALNSAPTRQIFLGLAMARGFGWDQGRGVEIAPQRCRVTESGWQCQGVVPPASLGIAWRIDGDMASAPRLLRQLRRPPARRRAAGRASARTARFEHFPSNDPVVIMLVTSRRKMPLGGRALYDRIGRACGFVEDAETIEDGAPRNPEDRDSLHD